MRYFASLALLFGALSLVGCAPAETDTGTDVPAVEVPEATPGGDTATEETGGDTTETTETTDAS